MGVVVGGGVGVAVGDGSTTVGVCVGSGVEVAVGFAKAFKGGVGTGITVDAGIDVLVAVASTMAVGCNACSVAPVFVQATLVTIIVATKANTACEIKTLCQMNQGRAIAATLPRLRLERACKRMARQMLAHHVSQDALASAMNDAH